MHDLMPSGAAIPRTAMISTMSAVFVPGELRATVSDMMQTWSRKADKNDVRWGCGIVTVRFRHTARGTLLTELHLAALDASVVSFIAQRSEKLKSVKCELVPS